MRMCNAEIQKSSAKDSNFKEYDSALALLEFLLYMVATKLYWVYSYRSHYVA